MTHILLVHGAWHGAWCWHKAMPALAAAGFKPHAIDLPGHGLRATETQTLSAYAESVADKLNALPEPAVLLGHSMGGAVISAAAELVPDRISTLVYLCAFMNRTGESIFGRAGSDDETLLGSLLEPQPDGRLTVRDDGLKPAFYADCADEDLALARLCLVPQSPEPFAAEPTLTADRYGQIRRAYIVCTQDKAIGPKKQRELIATTGCDAQTDLDASHSPFFSAPSKLAEAIRRVL